MKRLFKGEAYRPYRLRYIIRKFAKNLFLVIDFNLSLSSLKKDIRDNRNK
ncbi:MAG: hypothetical protein LBH59_06910 [Planctomycetaceae bacterium]|nr:hypothetical protein [Planctomycetaceae bacterium]